MMANNNEPLVTVIIPVYKVEQYLSRCVLSVQAQKYCKWEMILIDDGSPDNCPQMCDEYAKTDGRIRVIHKKNEGQAVARNVALDVAKGDYIFFLDSDDYIHSDALRDMVNICQKENADIVQCTFIRGSENTFPKIRKDSKIAIYDNHSIFYSRIQKIIVWGKLYRKELWNGIRMPAGKLNYEDDATTWKLYYRSRKTVYVNTPYFYYFENPTSTMVTQQKAVNLAFIPAYLERIEFFEKEGDKLLTNLSKWRFCLPLMLCYMKGNVRKEDLRTLLDNFYNHNKAVISCNKVRLEHRILIALFSCCPKLIRKLSEKLGLAHAI